MRDFVRQPERNQLGIETKALSFRIGNAREMFETDESDSLSINNELARIRGPYSNHEHDIYVSVNIE